MASTDPSTDFCHRVPEQAASGHARRCQRRRDLAGLGRPRWHPGPPGGTHGFGWRYDHEDVFIAQTVGVKDYYFRDNTVDRHTPLGVQPDFTLFTRERSQLATARLIPGDWLYLPSHWWHMAKCLEDSLSISTGMYPLIK